MESFALDWLALREPADRRALNGDVLAALQDWGAGRAGLHVTDLGAGTGAAWRHLTPWLPAGTGWTLVDHDKALLGRASRRIVESGAPAPALRSLNLATDLDRLDPGAGDLVSASALIDLVSEGWLTVLRDNVRRAGAALWIGLAVDGRVAWEPSDAADAVMLDHVARDQARNKGFGPALGGRAPAVAEALLRTSGHRVVAGPSDWRLGPEDGALQRAFLDGHRCAALDAAPGEAAAIEGWTERRIRAIDAGRSQLVVGHRDLFAAPPPG